MPIPYFEKPVNRREALRWMAVGSSSLFLSYVGGGCTRLVPLTQDRCFPQSVASGDPRPESVILWTRVVDHDTPQGDYPVLLEIATEETFHQTIHAEIYTAMAVMDHCLKVKITELDPGCHYYYRFTYQGIQSRTGRTKTAPSKDDAREISFAFVSGQDYGGRYYNAYAHMLQWDGLDFVVHLGDYIYETVGDPSFQLQDPVRTIVFRDAKGALGFKTDHGIYFAASSLDNYRQLYQTYRRDPILQKVHERFPMIAMWDDHEYHDDYAGNVTSEDAGNRRQNARQAYFEYMPVETGMGETGVFQPNDDLWIQAKTQPHLYRAFHFGSNLQLIMSDYRTFRPQHTIPDDAFIGAVFADKQQLIDLYEDEEPATGEEKYLQHQEQFSPYIDLDASAYAAYRSPFARLIFQMYVAEGKGMLAAGMLSRKYAKGKINAFVANAMIEAYNKNVSPEGKKLDLLYNEIDDIDYQKLERGLSFLDLGKIAEVSSGGIGTKVLVRKEAFDLFARIVGEQNVYGTEQLKWIEDCLEGSGSRQVVFANSVSLTPMAVDLSDLEVLPEEFRSHYYINLDQFDGFPLAREKILRLLKMRNSMVISGDIHANFVTDHGGILEATGAAVSSASATRLFHQMIDNEPLLAQNKPLIDALKALDLDQRLKTCNRQCPSPDKALIRYNDTTHNGYSIVTVSDEHTRVTMFALPSSRVMQNLYDHPNLNDLFTHKSFLVPPAT